MHPKLQLALKQNPEAKKNFDTLSPSRQKEIVRYINTPDAKTQLFNTGAEAVGSTPEELKAAMSADIAKYGKIARAIATKTN